MNGTKTVHALERATTVIGCDNDAGNLYSELERVMTYLARTQQNQFTSSALTERITSAFIMQTLFTCLHSEDCEGQVKARMSLLQHSFQVVQS